jgi:hypothetical protein
MFHHWIFLCLVHTKFKQRYNMKFFDKIFSRKTTSAQAIRIFKKFAADSIAGFRKKSELFVLAFPQNNEVDNAVEIIDREFKRLDDKSSRAEQINLFKSIYLKSKNEQKLAHLIGSKADENIALFMVIQIDEGAKDKVISAFEEEGEVALERYKNFFRVNYLRRWLIYVIIEAGLIFTYEELFKSKIESDIIKRYDLMLDDHLNKLMAEVLITYDASLWKTRNVKNTDYDFTAVYKRSQAMSIFLNGVEQNDYEIMEKGTKDYVNAMNLNYASIKQDSN